MRTTRSSPILIACAAPAGGAAALVTRGAASEPAASVKPWTHDNECVWWLSGPDGKSHRASIEQSNDGVSLGISDLAFRTWSVSDRIKVELRFNHDPKRRVTTDGWVTRGEGYAMFALYLDTAALRKIAGATALELRRHGKTVVELKVSGTPTEVELLACVPSSSSQSDSE